MPNYKNRETLHICSVRTRLERYDTLCVTQIIINKYIINFHFTVGQKISNTQAYKH